MPRKTRKDDSDDVKATPDAYTGMLAISLLALVGGGVFLYLDYSKYPKEAPPTSPIPGTQINLSDDLNPNPGGGNPNPNPGGGNPNPNPGGGNPNPIPNPGGGNPVPMPLQPPPQLP